MNRRTAVLDTLPARRMRRGTALLCAPLLVVTACTGGGSPSRPTSSSTSSAAGSGPVVALRPTSPPTGAQLSYGTSIGRIPGVTYQPDVVVIGGGASSIRAADGSGYIWTIAGSAPGASSLHVGSVMVATTLASGRVLQVRDVAGGDRQVVLGPVALTDVIRDGHFATSAPVPITEPLNYTFPSDPSAEQLPASGTTVTTHSARETRLGSTGVAADVPIPNVPAPKIPVPKIPHLPKIPTDPPGASETTGIKLPEPTHQAQPWTEGDFTLTPHCCSPIGITAQYHGQDGRMLADVGIDTGKPRLEADVSIGGSSLVKASLELYDAADAYFDFDAATKNVKGNKPTTLFRIPERFQIPLPPFSIEVSVTMTASIQLAGQAVLQSHAKYALDGPLGVTFDGTPHFLHPKVRTVTSVSNSGLSLGVSVNAISLGFNASLSIGFGVPGIHVGPFVSVNTALAYDKDGSPPQTSLKEGCSDAKVKITGVFGVGYSIAEPVRKVINFFLNALNIKPILKSSDGPRWPFTIWDPPESQRCATRQ